MSGDHGAALHSALVAHLRADAGVRARLGELTRVFDAVPKQAAFPLLLIERSESRAVPADGCGIEHRLMLRAASTFGGVPEVQAVVAAVRGALAEAVLEADGVRTVSVRVTFSDVFRSADLRRTWAVIRVRAVTEEV